MTSFYPLRLIGPDGGATDFDALVDTGSSFTSVPGESLREIGVRPVRRVRLRLASGESHVQEVGEVRAEIDDNQVSTIVVFGPSGSPPVIGAYTLEGLLLRVDPTAQKLVPVEGWWA